MKIAVIGAGIFGSTTAIALAKHGFHVDLLEQESDILQAASGANQFRLHRGYHYPRSSDTAISSKKAEASFVREYRDAVIDGFEHYYYIASKESKTSAAGFIRFCQNIDLEYEIVDAHHAHRYSIDLALKVRESLIDHHALKRIILKRLSEHKVNIFLNTKFHPDKITHDIIVNCTYANLNSVLQDHRKHREYQFEVCEKPLIRLSKTFHRKSIVVLDGPFFCIDPFGRTDAHLMGNVVHAIHAANTGYAPHVPGEIKNLLNKGLITNPKTTNFRKFIESAIGIMPEMGEAEHVGSMYTVRTVLPDTDRTDERPTLVSAVDDRVIQVFSGKIGNCVDAADQVVSLLCRM